MKFLIVLLVVAICGKTCLALPSGTKYNLKSSGVVCEDSEGGLVECNEGNSRLPNDLKVKGVAIPNEYVCLDVTYRTGLLIKKSHHVQQCANQLKGLKLCNVLKKQNDVSKCIEHNPAPKPEPTPEPPSGMYCIVDDLDDTVECNSENSELPDDLNDNSARKSNEYICLDVIYETGWIPFRESHHVQQCARELSGDKSLCDVLHEKNSISSCTEATPYPSPTVEPPSNAFCAIDDDGDTLQCNSANSKLPKDVNIGRSVESSSYICLALTYETGIWPLKTTHTVRQCAHQLVGEDLCDVLRKTNDVDACRDWNPDTPQSSTIAPTTAAPTTAAPTKAPTTTAAPTTAAPITVAPTTAAPTTAAPTTAAPTTAAPTTAAPTTASPTVAPTTAAPTTAAPTTAAPTTTAPTTAAPTTAAPTTAAPVTTAAPTTAAPTTIAPTTAAPTTSAPTTAAPTTATPTLAPSTAAPTTAAPTTAAPTTAAPTTAPPTTSEPITATPTKAAPTTAAPTTSEPITATPTTAAPPTAAPSSSEPITATPTTAAPTTAAPTTAEPTTL